MNICYLIPSFGTLAGSENYVYHMSIALAKQGHHVHIVSLTGKGKRDFKGLDDKIVVHQVGCRINPLRYVWGIESIIPLSTWRYGRLMKRVLPAIVNDHGIDIIEATDWGMDAWAYMPERQVPVCVRLHGYPGFKDEFDRGVLRKWPRNHIYWTLQRKHILAADLVTGVSKGYTNFVREAWEINDKEVTIIPIAVDVNVFRPGDGPRDDQSVLFVGRLEKSKGIEILAQAIPLVMKSFPRVKFYMAGRDCKYRGTQQTGSQYLTGKFQKEHVVYLGSLSTRDLLRYYQASTLCVVPSLYEPGGTVVFEAMACGCPVLASRVGGLDEVIVDGQTGLLRPPGDAEALADGIIQMLQKAQERQEMSRRALAGIHHDFDITIIAQKTAAAYASAIQRFRATYQGPAGRSVGDRRKVLEV